jgi:16S rRNA (uracil1498-N3)-methyltransferase
MELFFCKDTNTSSFDLPEAEAHHAIQVLRYQIGDNILITNGSGVFLKCKIISATKKKCTVQVLSEEKIEISKSKILLAIAPTKSRERMEWCLEKATEMGVHTIVPLICDRTIHERFKMDRLQNILQSAMIQSQQAWLPVLTTPTDFNEFITSHQASDKYIAHCEPADKKNIKALAPSNNCILLIGPEGDFTLPEIDVAMQHNYQPIHLGPTRLRTETAGIFALSVLKKF